MSELPLRWWQALNPPVYLVSVLPGWGAWLLLRPHGKDGAALLLATVAVVCLQHAINLFNDVTDWRLGADVDKWDSWVRYHQGRLEPVKRHAWLSFCVGGLLGLLALAWVGRLWVLWLALPLVALGCLYNVGPRPLSYTRHSEWLTGLCYGPGVFACLWLLASPGMSLTALFGSLAFGCLAVGLLLSHQPPQIESDRLAGKHSFAATFGREATLRAVRWLFLAFLLAWAAALASQSLPLGMQAVNAAVSLPLLAGLWQRPPNPRRLLLSATALMVAVWQAGRIVG